MMPSRSRVVRLALLAALVGCHPVNDPDAFADEFAQAACEWAEVCDALYDVPVYYDGGPPEEETFDECYDRVHRVVATYAESEACRYEEDEAKDCLRELRRMRRREECDDSDYPSLGSMPWKVCEGAWTRNGEAVFASIGMECRPG